MRCQIHTMWQFVERVPLQSLINHYSKSLGKSTNVELVSCLCCARPSGHRIPRRNVIDGEVATTWTTVNMSAPKTSENDNSGTSSNRVKGEYVRKQSVFRNFVTADGSSGFKAETDRYHLYVCLACPWAHRTLVTRKLKGLENVIPYTVVDWFNGKGGWHFTDKDPKCTIDPLFGFKYLKEIYLKADPEYSGRITVPVLWDKKTNTIVNNESSEILRMFNKEFNAFCKTPEQQALDLYPDELKKAIDEVNEWVYPQINNGVYRCGFATTQEAYDTASKEVFEGLDRAEAILSTNRYLTGSQLTEADVRLFTSLVRFDHVYHTHFKCNRRLIMNYPNLWGFTRDIYQQPGVAETVDMNHIRKHYYISLKKVNPYGIVPIGPQINFMAAHNRASLST